MPKVTFSITENLFDAVPHPKPASKLIPSWYKRMDHTFQDEAHGLNWAKIKGGAWQRFNTSRTLKQCLPVRDYLTGGYIIPAWKDIMIIRKDDGKYASVSPTDEQFAFENMIGVQWHYKEQFKNSPLEKMVDGEKAVKILNPWVIKTPVGYSSLIFSPFYHKNDIEIMPAIVDTDKHDTPVHFPCILHSEEAVLQRNTPFVQVVPFKRENWSHETQKHSKTFLHDLERRAKLIAGSIYTREFWKRKVFR